MIAWVGWKQKRISSQKLRKVSKSEKAEEPQTANLFKNPQPASALPTDHHKHWKFLSKFIEMYPNFHKSVWNNPSPRDLLRTNWIMPPRVQSLRRKTICQNIHVFIIFYCCEPTMIVLLFKIYQENIKIISNVDQFQRMLITLLSSIQTCIFSVEFSSADYESEHW